MNENKINVNHLQSGMQVEVYGRFMPFDHICHGPRGDSRWICVKAFDGSVTHRATHRWSREMVRVLLPDGHPWNH